MRELIGSSVYHPDAAAALLVEGSVVSAAEEERLNRIKHSAGFPSGALKVVSKDKLPLRRGLRAAVGRSRRARLLKRAAYGLRLPRFALRRVKTWRQLDQLSDLIRQSLDLPATDEFACGFVEHHRAHLASSFLVSPFDQAAVVSLDGLGDFASAMWGLGRGNRIEVLGESTFPHSLGFYYTAITQYLGFSAYGDEYKVMGLAALGEPEYLDIFRDIVRSHPRTGFRLNLKYFRHQNEGVEMTWTEGPPTLGSLWSQALVNELGPPRDPRADIEPRHQNVAASLQARLEEVLLEMLRCLYNQAKLDALCLAGGVAFNCVANGKIFRETPFRHVYVPPAPGDAGLAIGAPLWHWHQELGRPREFVMDRADWGPAFSESEMRRAFDRNNVEYRRFDSEDELCRVTARLIAEGKIVGWFQGGMEFGPRALGSRSILADPRLPDMKDRLNRRIKYREPFRPFAPSILQEHQAEYFEETNPSPFMSFAFPVRREKRSRIPAVTHVDGTARLQTVTREANPLFYRLIRAFEAETGVPLLLNTSFNENEPIVCKPDEAIECYLRTQIDALVLGPLVAEKPDLAGRSLTRGPV